METKRRMNWGDEPESCNCLLEVSSPVVARMHLQQNRSLVAAAGDRFELSDQINGAHGECAAKYAKLEEKANVYLEHHNLYLEKKADLIDTASAPALVDSEGRSFGWDKMASDSPAKRTRAKLDLIESATLGQIEHANELLVSVKDQEKCHNELHGSMERSAIGHLDFEEAVAHSRHLGQKSINALRTTLMEHLADHKRFLTRIKNARNAKFSLVSSALVGEQSETQAIIEKLAFEISKMSEEDRLGLLDQVKEGLERLGTENFANDCHGDDGRFCETGVLGRLKKTWDKVPELAKFNVAVAGLSAQLVLSIPDVRSMVAYNTPEALMYLAAGVGVLFHKNLKTHLAKTIAATAPVKKTKGVDSRREEILRQSRESISRIRG